MKLKALSPIDDKERASYAQNRARASALDTRKERSRALNDRFRATMAGGRWMITRGVQALVD